MATNFEFYELVIKIGAYRCPKCWVEDRKDNSLQSADDLGAALHRDTCGEDLNSEPGILSGTRPPNAIRRVHALPVQVKTRQS